MPDPGKRCGTAIEVDPACADAHYNLAGLREKLGDRTAALRHLNSYRKLINEAR